jgi:hypothetical protein
MAPNDPLRVELQWRGALAGLEFAVAGGAEWSGSEHGGWPIAAAAGLLQQPTGVAGLGVG